MHDPNDQDTEDLQPSSPLARAALDYAAGALEGDTTGHDMHHVRRVFRTAQRLAVAEGADVETVELIAALHDIADFKFTGDERSGSRSARRWLLSQGVGAERADRIAADIASISFKGARTPTTPLTLEGQCVQDADRLDALGAVGIARCFAYGGSVGRPIHDPSVPVAEHTTTGQYLRHRGTSINHFHEKLLLLKDRLHTETARHIAADRHDYMVAFLEQFRTEVSVGDCGPGPSRGGREAG